MQGPRRILGGLQAAYPTPIRHCEQRGLAHLSRSAIIPGHPLWQNFFGQGDFLHHLNLEIALRHQLLQPPILHLELPQALDIARLQTTEALAPSVDRLLANAVPLGHRRHRIAIRLSDDRHHLLFRNRPFRIAPSESGASLSTYRWSENPRTGQGDKMILPRFIAASWDNPVSPS